jgi:hypothetical protein
MRNPPRHEGFRLDTTLALAAVVVSIVVVFVSPQSRLAVGACLALIFAFGLYPAFHAADQVLGRVPSAWARNAVASVVWLLAVSAFCFLVWPHLHRHTLSAKERIAFEEPLKSQKQPRLEIHIGCPGDDEKACVFANQFVRLFGESGWKVQSVVERLTLSRPAAGVYLFRKGGAAPKTPYEWNIGGWLQINDPSLLSVQKAFQQIGIEPESGTNYQLADDVMMIYIGTEKENEAEPTNLTSSTKWVQGKGTTFPKPQ